MTPRPGEKPKEDPRARPQEAYEGDAARAEELARRREQRDILKADSIDIASLTFSRKITAKEAEGSNKELAILIAHSIGEEFKKPHNANFEKLLAASILLFLKKQKLGEEEFITSISVSGGELSIDTVDLENKPTRTLKMVIAEKTAEEEDDDDADAEDDDTDDETAAPETLKENPGKVFFALSQYKKTDTQKFTEAQAMVGSVDATEYKRGKDTKNGKHYKQWCIDTIAGANELINLRSANKLGPVLEKHVDRLEDALKSIAKISTSGDVQANFNTFEADPKNNFGASAFSDTELLAKDGAYNVILGYLRASKNIDAHLADNTELKFEIRIGGKRYSQNDRFAAALKTPLEMAEREEDDRADPAREPEADHVGDRRATGKATRTEGGKLVVDGMVLSGLTEAGATTADGMHIDGTAGGSDAAMVAGPAGVAGGASDMVMGTAGEIKEVVPAATTPDAAPPVEKYKDQIDAALRDKKIKGPDGRSSEFTLTKTGELYSIRFNDRVTPITYLGLNSEDGMTETRLRGYIGYAIEQNEVEYKNTLPNYERVKSSPVLQGYTIEPMTKSRPPEVRIHKKNKYFTIELPPGGAYRPDAYLTDHDAPDATTFQYKKFGDKIEGRDYDDLLRKLVRLDGEKIPADAVKVENPEFIDAASEKDAAKLAAAINELIDGMKEGRYLHTNPNLLLAIPVDPTRIRNVSIGRGYLSGMPGKDILDRNTVLGFVIKRDVSTLQYLSSDGSVGSVEPASNVDKDLPDDSWTTYDVKNNRDEFLRRLYETYKKDIEKANKRLEDEKLRKEREPATKLFDDLTNILDYYVTSVGFTGRVYCDKYKNTSAGVITATSSTDFRKGEYSLRLFAYGNGQYLVEVRKGDALIDGTVWGYNLEDDPKKGDGVVKQLEAALKRHGILDAPAAPAPAAPAPAPETAPTDDIEKILIEGRIPGPDGLEVNSTTIRLTPVEGKNDSVVVNLNFFSATIDNGNNPNHIQHGQTYQRSDLKVRIAKVIENNKNLVKERPVGMAKIEQVAKDNGYQTNARIDMRPARVIINKAGSEKYFYIVPYKYSDGYVAMVCDQQGNNKEPGYFGHKESVELLFADILAKDTPDAAPAAPKDGGKFDSLASGELVKDQAEKNEIDKKIDTIIQDKVIRGPDGLEVKFNIDTNPDSTVTITFDKDIPAYLNGSTIYSQKNITQDALRLVLIDIVTRNKELYKEYEASRRDLLSFLRKATNIESGASFVGTRPKYLAFKFKNGKVFGLSLHKGFDDDSRGAYYGYQLESVPTNNVPLTEVKHIGGKMTAWSIESLLVTMGGAEVIPALPAEGPKEDIQIRYEKAFAEALSPHKNKGIVITDNYFDFELPYIDGTEVKKVPCKIKGSEFIVGGNKYKVTPSVAGRALTSITIEGTALTDTTTLFGGGSGVGIKNHELAKILNTLRSGVPGYNYDLIPGFVRVQFTKIE